MDCTVHGVAKSRTRLTDFHFHFQCKAHWKPLADKICSLICNCSLQQLTFSKMIGLDEEQYCSLLQWLFLINIYVCNRHRYAYTYIHTYTYEGFPGSSDGKESACNVGDPGSIPGSGRYPGEGNGNPLQYSRLGNLIGYSLWGLKELDMIE